MEKEEELFIPKTKHKGLKIILAILLIAGLIAGGYYLYQYKFNNPNTIVTNVLEDAREELKEALAKETDTDNYKVDGHLKINTNADDETLKLLNDIELQFTGEIDQKNALGNFTLDTKYKSDELIGINGYYENKVLYVLLDGLYDKYIKADINEMENDVSAVDVPKIEINKNDMEVVIDSLITAFSKEIDNLDIAKENAKITIGDKDVEVIDNAIVLKDKEVNNFAKGIVKNLKNDQKFINILTKLAGEDAKTYLEEMEKGIDEEEFKGTYKINFYTDRGFFEKKIISLRQTIIQDEMTSTINVDKVSDEEIIVEVSSMGITATIKLKKNNSAVNASLNINVMGISVKIELNMNYEKIKEVTKTDVSNNIDYKKLTDKDTSEIVKKLMENKAIEKLMTEINKLQNAEA